MSERWTAKTQKTVCGYHNAWSFSEPENSRQSPTECQVHFEIQGDVSNGFLFIMAPDGFFTADAWVETLDEAFELGAELGLERDEWQPCDAE